MKVYNVYYFRGGWSNFESQYIVGLFTKSESNIEIASLNKMGYPAFRIEVGSKIGAVEDSKWYLTDEEKKEAWNMIVKYGFVK